jgi:aminotransferase
MKKKKISKKVINMPPSGIRAFFDLVLGMKDVISLGVGEPDFVTPWNIIESGIYSLEKGYTSYTSNKGLKELRQQVSRYLKKENNLDYDPEDEILITAGVSEGFDLALRALVNDGDEIIVVRPSYVSYGPLSYLAGAKEVYLDTNLKNGFKITPGDLDKKITKKTKAIILNYPSNPTGTSYKKRELEEILKVAEKRDVLVISDEIYGILTYDYNHVPFPSLKGARERTVYLNGFSKAYAMTGWRVGYACGPKEIISAMTKIHQYTMMCVSITGQMAAVEALRGSKKPVADMKKEYKRRREIIVGELNDMGLKCHTPQGAFYCFPSVKSSGLKSVDFASRLLKKEKVAVVPGVAFSPHADDYVRMSYASGLDNIKEAMSRVRRFLSKSSG